MYRLARSDSLSSSSWGSFPLGCIIHRDTTRSKPGMISGTPHSDINTTGQHQLHTERKCRDRLRHFPSPEDEIRSPQTGRQSSVPVTVKAAHSPPTHTHTHTTMVGHTRIHAFEQMKNMEQHACTFTHVTRDTVLLAGVSKKGTQTNLPESPRVLEHAMLPGKGLPAPSTALGPADLCSCVCVCMCVCVCVCE